jgi:hypothetical protein
LSWDLFIKVSTNGYPYLLCSRDFFSSSIQMGSHISFLLKNSSFQVFHKLVPMFFFPKISMKLQVVDPTHKQIKFVQSSIKSTQVWSSSKNFSFQKNPLLTNPIDSNQLSLKLWFEINYALKASWKYLNNHVWWCCVRLYFYVLIILFIVDYLQGILRMGVLVVWRWWVMLTCYYGPWIIHHPQRCMWYWPCKMVHSRMWYINYTPRGTTSWWLTFFLHTFSLVCFQSNHNNNNNSNVTQQK